ncbi:hypothetical protein Z043_120197, partial [Scleropages formosus]
QDDGPRTLVILVRGTERERRVGRDSNASRRCSPPRLLGNRPLHDDGPRLVSAGSAGGGASTAARIPRTAGNIMAESETERCQHLNPEGGVGELVHEGGGVEQTSDNAMTSEPTFLEEDGEEELDGVPVFGADDEEWSTETLRNESQQVAHTLSSKTQVSVSVLGTADMLRSDSRHDADVLRSDTQEDTDMLRSDNQHNTDTLKSYSQHDTDTLRSECRQGTDPPRSDCQHDIDTLRSESQHTSCTQQTSIQNATDSPENVSGQTFGMLWSSSRHAANTQSNESQSRTQHNKHRADSVWSESQHPSATLQNNSGHPPLH